jgi:hypothetical protein
LYVNWKWLKNRLLRGVPRSQKIFSAPMIGFAGRFALLQTEGRNAKENGYEAQNEDPGRQDQTEPQRHGSGKQRLSLGTWQDRGASCGDC